VKKNAEFHSSAYTKQMQTLGKLLNYYQADKLEAGCDEAGRGCYAGPVFAAAVILPKDFYHPLINDSKKLSEKQRAALAPIIKEAAIAWAIGSQTPAQIDEINILKASIKSMHLALDQLKKRPQFIAVDGNRFYPYKKIPHQTIIKGDGLYAHIAAASILAKTARDAYMIELHKKYPQYGWDQNKGYGTAAHRAAIALHGLCYEHRKSFKI
jgi:ribonuclease HII